VHETYRMLGREHELDFERHARSHNLARSLAREPVRSESTQVESRRPRWIRFVHRPFLPRPTG
jgi:hypothetical protein